MHVNKGLGRAVAVSILVTIAAPLTAQGFSDAYVFLKAVKERDGQKVQSLVSTPGSIVINTHDQANGDSALHYVVRDRDLVWLNFLLGRGARPDTQNRQGETPLTLATQYGWIEGAELLLARRASVDLANRRGETPLILAVHKRDLAMVRVLLARGANPKRTDSAAGYSAIDYARQDPRAAPILRLLEQPATPTRAVAGPTR
jgi:ankyrin repeat protein